MKTLPHRLMPGLLIVLTVISGLIHGKLTSRWTTAEEAQSVRELLSQLPRELGRWRLEEETPLDERTVAMLQCIAHSNRVYIDPESGERVSLTILYGPTGALTAHTPEVCYGGAYTPISRDDKVAIPTASQAAYSFSSVLFRSRDLAERPLRVYYAWYNGETWQGAKYPRWQFARYGHLWKVQVACFEDGAGGPNGDGGQEFLGEMLAAIGELLDGPSVIVKNIDS